MKIQRRNHITEHSHFFFLNCFLLRFAKIKLQRIARNKLLSPSISDAPCDTNEVCLSQGRGWKRDDKAERRKRLLRRVTPREPRELSRETSSKEERNGASALYTQAAAETNSNSPRKRASSAYASALPPSRESRRREFEGSQRADPSSFSCTKCDTLRWIRLIAFMSDCSADNKFLGRRVLRLSLSLSLARRNNYWYSRPRGGTSLNEELV